MSQNVSGIKRTLEEANGTAKRQRDDEENANAGTFVHLDQIQRGNLDFDMEKVCSVTLWPKSVFCCLVCGKYFQGKGHGSQLYIHCLEAGHFVAMSLSSGTIYSMPDGRVVLDSSLDDIRFNLKPTFIEEDLNFFRTIVRSIPEQRPPLRDFHGNRYFPGLVGLNDFHGTDYLNCVVQSLVRVRLFREYFLHRQQWENNESRVTRAFGELICQLFNPRRFKNTVSPNEFIQAVSSASQNKFQPGTRADAREFLAWFLTELHKGMLKSKTSLVHECFQGEVRVETTVLELKRDFDDEDDDEMRRRMSAGPQMGENVHKVKEIVTSSKVSRLPFLFLSLDLPTNPIFTENSDSLLDNATRTPIPHTTLLEVLHKFDGVRAADVNLPGGRLEQKRYLITRLPRYVIFHLNRFSKNNDSFIEKNRAVVSLPLADLDLSPFVESAQKVSYNLVSTVCHDGGVGPGVRNAVTEGKYKCNVYYPPKDSFFEMDNLNVKQIDMPQLVSVAETYLAVYERND